MPKRVIQVITIIVVITIAIAFKYNHWDNYLTLESLKAQQAALQGKYQSEPLLTGIIFSTIYMLITAASLPGAAILTLASGAIFGLFTGTIIASFSSSIGATAAMLVSRFFFRDIVKQKFRTTLEKVDKGIAKEGALYLFSLRLIPVFPFFVINLVMGVTQISLGTFFFVSQVGMLLATVAFVNAGTKLAQINSLESILSPSLLFSFSAIGLLPLFAKAAMRVLKNRKTLGRFRKPKQFDYNIIVVGAGSAGLVASYIAAALRAKVALIEKHRMGGDCLNTGCVPSKTLIRSAKVMALQKKAQALGFKSINVAFDFSEIMARVHSSIKAIEPHDSIERYSKLGVDCIEGEAKIISPYEVEVDGRKITSKNLIIATGARPIIPKLPGLSNSETLTSDTVWSLKTLPKNLVVLGGGPIGCELSQAFARLGSNVTIVEQSPRLLSREDNDISEVVRELLCEDRVELKLASKALEVTTEGTTKHLVIQTPNGVEKLPMDFILCAVGRAANTSGFGLETLGVEISKSGTIEHDEFLRTNFPNIFVCGDVAGPFQFTHTASHQAWYASVNALFSPLKKFKVDYTCIPRVTFTDPEIARVGLCESELTSMGIPYEVTKFELAALDRAIVDGETRGFVKVMTEMKSDKILGAYIAGANAGEFITEYVTAMKHGIGLNKILGTVHAYPTFAEANKYLAGKWKRAHAPNRLLNSLEKFHSWRRK